MARALGFSVGSLDLIPDTIAGIVAHRPDDGYAGLGRYGKVIRLGRSLWQSPTLTNAEQALAQETFFDDGSFPAAAESLKAAAQAVKNDEERPAPFDARTAPFARY